MSSSSVVDILPEIGGSEPTKVTDIGRGDDQVSFTQSSGLPGQDHIAVDRLSPAVGWPCWRACAQNTAAWRIAAVVRGRYSSRLPSASSRSMPLTLLARHS